MTDSFQQLTDRVWFYPHDPTSRSIQPGVGAIVTPNHTVLVDAGNGPPHARQIRAALSAMGAPPVTHVIYTHAHWDHAFGGQVWRNSTIVAHSVCRKHLLALYGDSPWSPVRIEEEVRQHPTREPALQALALAIGDWQQFDLVAPHLTFSGEMALILDGVTINLRHIGGSHAPDSIIVRLDDVLFIGDCYYPPPAHLRQPDDTLDFTMIEALLTENAAWYVEGHSQPKTHAEFSQLLNQR